MDQVSDATHRFSLLCFLLKAALPFVLRHVVAEECCKQSWRES